MALWELTAAEQRLFIAWVKEAFKRTSFDLMIFTYPRVAMLIADQGDDPLAFLPVQVALTAECFIPRPGATNKEKALALWRFDEALRDLARNMNIGDIYCWVPVGEEAYMDKIQDHGWEEIENVRLFKRKSGIKIPEFPPPKVEGKQCL